MPKLQGVIFTTKLGEEWTENCMYKMISCLWSVFTNARKEEKTSGVSWQTKASKKFNSGKKYIRGVGYIEEL